MASSIPSAMKSRPARGTSTSPRAAGRSMLPPTTSRSTSPTSSTCGAAWRSTAVDLANSGLASLQQALTDLKAEIASALDGALDALRQQIDDAVGTIIDTVVDTMRQPHTATVRTVASH